MRFSTTIYIALCLLMLTLILTLAGCGVGSAEFQPLRVGEIPWADDEVTLYQITNASGEDAGQMRITLSSLDGESRMMQREVGGVFRENLEITMKANNLRPIGSMLTRTHADGEEKITASYNGSKVNMQFTTKRNVTTDEQISIPSDSYDYRSIMMLLRALPLESGYATKVNGYLPISGTLERMEVIINRSETVEVPAGSFQAWKILMNTRSSRSTAWLSTEAPYVMVKYEDGANGATFELQSVEE